MTKNTKALDALAQRINAGHRAYLATTRKALEHALAAGASLQEAKDGLPHGEWLPWLQANCPAISDRSAQRYMRLAQNRNSLEGESATVAGLTVRAAEGLLAEAARAKPVPPATPFDLDDSNWWRFAGALLDAPFCAADFEPGDSQIGWLTTKMSHQISLPSMVGFCVGLHSDYGVPALKFCDMEELAEALKILAPLAKGETKFDFAMEEFSVDDLLRAALTLKLMAQRLAGGVLGEIKDRQEVEPEQFERQREKTLTKLQRRIETKIKEHAEAGAR